MVKPYKLGSLNCKAQIYSSLERTKNNVHSFTTGIKSFLMEHSSCFPPIDHKIFIKQALVSRKSSTMEDLLLFNRNKLFQGDHIRLLEFPQLLGIL